MSTTTCPHLVDTATCPTPCRRASEATPGEAMRVLVRRWRACAQSIMPISSDTAQQCASPPVHKRPKTAKSGGSAMGGLGPIVGFLAKRQSPRGPVQESENLFVLSVPAAGARRWWSPQVTLFPTDPPTTRLSRRSAPELPPPEGAHQFRLGWLCVCLLRGPRSVWVHCLCAGACSCDQDASMTMTMISHLVCYECIYHALRTCDLTRMKTPSRIFTTPV